MSRPNEIGGAETGRAEIGRHRAPRRQRARWGLRATAGVGAVFGPIMLAWFGTIATRSPIRRSGDAGNSSTPCSSLRRVT